MSTWADKIEREMAEFGRQIKELREDRNFYPARARLEDVSLGRRISRATRRWVAVELGTICGGQRVVAQGLHTFDASYDTGGETIANLAQVPSRQTVFMNPRAMAGTLYTFQWDNAGAKMKVFTGGAEVAAATDLSTLLLVPYLVVGQGPTARGRYRARGDEILVRAQLEVGAEAAVDASAYWTFQLYRRNAAQTVGWPVGDAYTTATRTLTARSPVTLYEEEKGTPLEDDDHLVLDVAETTAAGSSAPALSDAVLWLDIARSVR